MGKCQYYKIILITLHSCEYGQRESYPSVIICCAVVSNFDNMLFILGALGLFDDHMV